MSGFTRRRLFQQASLVASALTLKGERSFDQEWVRTCRGVILEAYSYPFYPKYQYSPEKAVEIALAVRANAIRYPAASFFAYYPTKTRYPVEPAIRVDDPMARTVELGHKDGLKVFAYIPINAPFLDVRSKNAEFQDCMKRSATGQLYSGRGAHGYGEFYESCINSSWRADMLEMIREVAGRYEMDAIYIDGPYSQGLHRLDEPCHCRHCRAAYLKAKNKEVPLKTSDREEYREWFLWMRDDVSTALMREIRETIRNTRNVPAMFNNTALLSPRDYRTHLYPEMDGFMFEASETPEQKLFNLQLGRSTGKIIWTYISGYHRGFYGYPVEGQELLLDGAVALAAGVGTVYWSANRYHALPRDPLSYDAGRYLRQIHEFAAAHETITANLRPVPQAGILVSTLSVEWYPELPASYKSCYYGAHRLFKDVGYDAEPFLDHSFSLRTLAKYPLVYLPMAFCLSKMQCAELEQYVAAGGTLIATHLTSIADEAGRRRADLGLAELLGVRLKSQRPAVIPDLYVRAPRGGEMLPQAPHAILFETAGADVLWETFDLAQAETFGPAVAGRRHGKGYCMYIGSSPETAYSEDGLKPLRAFFGTLLAPYLEKHRTYTVDYHAGLTPHLMASDNQLVLHLVANFGTKTNKVRVPEEFVPLERVAIRVRVPARKHVRSVKLLRARSDLPYSIEDGWVVATVPRILIHEAVDVELG